MLAGECLQIYHGFVSVISPFHFWLDVCMFTFWNPVCLACQTKTPFVPMGDSGMAMSLAAVPWAERQDLSLFLMPLA